MTELLTTTFWATYDLMKSMVPSLYCGLFMAHISLHSPIAQKGERVLPFIARVTGLPPACAFSIILAAGDRTASMAAVAMVRTQADLTDQEVLAANFVAKAPSVLQFFLFSFIPVMVSVYPFSVAVHFLSVYFLAFMSISLGGIIYARLIRRQGQIYCADRMPKDESGKGSWRQAVQAAAVKSWRPLISMAGPMAAMSFAAILFIKTGYLNRLTDYLPFLTTIGLDGQTLSLAGIGLVSMLGGVAATGAALNNGVLPVAQVVPLLLAISLLHNVYDLFSASVPRYMAVFGHRLGLKVALVSFGVTQAVMLTMTVLTVKGWL